MGRNGNDERLYGSHITGKIRVVWIKGLLVLIVANMASEEAKRGFESRTSSKKALLRA